MDYHVFEGEALGFVDGQRVSELERDLPVGSDDDLFDAFVFHLLPFRTLDDEIVFEAVRRNGDFAVFDLLDGSEIPVDETAFQILGDHHAGPDLEVEIDRRDAVLRIELSRNATDELVLLLLVLREFGIVMGVDHVVEREQVDRLGVALSLLEFGEGRNLSVADLVQEFHEFRVFRTLDFVELDFFEVLIGLGLVELQRPVFRYEFLDGDLVGIHVLGIYGRKLFRIPDQYDLQSSERTEIVPFVFQDEIDFVEEVRSYHRYFVDDEGMDERPLDVLPFDRTVFRIHSEHFQSRVYRSPADVNGGDSGRSSHDHVLVVSVGPFGELSKRPRFSSTGVTGKEYVLSRTQDLERFFLGYRLCVHSSKRITSNSAEVRESYFEATSNTLFTSESGLR